MPKAGVPARVPPLPRDTPEGMVPDSVKLIGVSPVAVTAKVPAVFSANVVDDADVMEGPTAVTVNVKDWVVVFEFTSVAVMVIGSLPALPTAGVPARAPLVPRETPVGRAPDSV